MAGEVINQIKEAVSKNSHFLVSGGAGSGKTYSLVETLTSLHEEYPKEKIVCITFTNVASEEVKKRAPYENIESYTIHDFIWGVIKNYQKDLKQAIISLVKKEREEAKTGLKCKDGLLEDEDSLKGFEVKYKEYRKIEEGVISHDDVFKIAEYMFCNYPLLNRILRDSYRFILVDEYQDTEKVIIDILLKYLNEASAQKTIVGFFGDSMQSIYSGRVGDLSEYIENGTVLEIKKKDNWRCSKTVIELINKFRSDIQQKSMNPDVCEGDIKFIYSHEAETDFEQLKKHDVFKGWNFSDHNETKELYLTYNLIASKAGFGELFKIYNNDDLIKFIRRIKSKLNDLGSFEEYQDCSVSDVLDKEFVKPTKAFADFIDRNKLLYDSIRNDKFKDVSSAYLDSDLLVGNDKSKLIRHLTKIQKCLYFYENNAVNEFLKITDMNILTIKDLKVLKEKMNDLVQMASHVIEEVIEYAHEYNIVIKDDSLNQLMESNSYEYNRVKQIPYHEFISCFDFDEDMSPYSTQHGIKGAEFENVFVILDNGRWNAYNFNHLFSDTPGKESVIERTIKMFYVCCSRSKRNLVVYFNSPTQDVLSKAESWFGKENVLEVKCDIG